MYNIYLCYHVLPKGAVFRHRDRLQIYLTAMLHISSAIRSVFSQFIELFFHASAWILHAKACDGSCNKLYNASFFIWWISGLPKVFYLSYVANKVFSCWLSGFICLLVKIFTCSWRVSLLHIELYSILSLLHINFIIAAWWFISFSISLVCFVTQTHYSS